MSDKCHIFRGFKPRSKKDREARLRNLFLASVLHLPSDPSHSEQVPNVSDSVRSAPPDLTESRGRFS